MNTEVQAIGPVRATRSHAENDFWAGELASITLADGFSADALTGLCEFSHVKLLLLIHIVDPATVVAGARQRRNNEAWPAVGIFANAGRSDRPA